MPKKIRAYLKHNDGYWIDFISDVISFFICDRIGHKWDIHEHLGYTSTGVPVQKVCKRCGCYQTGRYKV